MRILGIDLGSNTIGIAVSDELGISAQGLKTIFRKSMAVDLQEIQTIVERYQIGKIVVGMPMNMDGTMGTQASKVMQWVETVKRELGIPIETWDERLSTVEASRILIEADLSRKKRKKVIDKLAAVIILQGYLDQGRHQDGELPSPA